MPPRVNVLVPRRKRVREEREEPETTEDAPYLFDDMVTIFRRRLATVGDGLVIKPSPPKGLGLFAAKPFKKGEAVTYYSGAFLSWRAAREIGGPGDASVSHFRQLEPMRWVIDGRFGDSKFDAQTRLPRLGGGVMINDARPAGVQNVEFKVYESPEYAAASARFREGLADERNARRGRVVYVAATRPIAAGDEILISYGEDYFAPDSSVVAEEP